MNRLYAAWTILSWLLLFVVCCRMLVLLLILIRIHLNWINFEKKNMVFYSINFDVVATPSILNELLFFLSFFVILWTSKHSNAHSFHFNFEAIHLFTRCDWPDPCVQPKDARGAFTYVQFNSIRDVWIVPNISQKNYLNSLSVVA